MKVWIPVIVALVSLVGTLVPCFLVGDAKQQRIYDLEAKLDQAQLDKAMLAGELAALRVAQPEVRHRYTRRGGAMLPPAPEPEQPKTLNGETVRALAQAESSAVSGGKVAAKRTWLRQTFVKQPGRVPEKVRR